MRHEWNILPFLLGAVLMFSALHTFRSERKTLMGNMFRDHVHMIGHEENIYCGKGILIYTHTHQGCSYIIYDVL